jgi:4-alpha-glucanotransferase
VPGPGAALFEAIKRELGALPFIAEDLGFITHDVLALRDRFHLPGNRVLQFAFDGNTHNPHLPEHYNHNTVVYTGTHDNPTTREWFDDLSQHARRILRHHLHHDVTPSEVAGEMIRLALDSRAALAVIPMQDLLNLGPEGRMNRPGSTHGNWRWRCTDEMCFGPEWERLADLTRSAARLTPIRTKV